MTPASPRRLTVLVAPMALLVAAVPAHASAATLRTSAPAPVVTSFSPAKAEVGDVLTVRGRGLRSSKRRTTVAFRRAGGKVVFAPATAVTATRLKVRVPATLAAQMPVVGGVTRSAVFQLRVLTTRFGKAYTAVKASPMIGPDGSMAKAAVTPTPVAAPTPSPTATASPTSAPQTVDPQTLSPVVAPATPQALDPAVVPVEPAGPTAPPCVATDDAGDADGDLLSNGDERRIKTDPCAADSDGDTISDYFEQRSAQDLNSAALPYPGKRPYPNPLDATDATTDFDGDGLTLDEEQLAWVKTGAPRTLTYSDGTQNTGGPAAIGTVAGTDLDGDGTLSDDEKDLDRDGLTNWDETHGRATPAWWVGTYKLETPYVDRSYAALDFVDPDVDGDGLADGIDDEDHDGFTNVAELARPDDWRDTYVSTTHPGTNPRARVNPFNPCKPFFSSTCHRHPAIGAYPDLEDWASPVYADGP